MKTTSPHADIQAALNFFRDALNSEFKQLSAEDWRAEARTHLSRASAALSDSGDLLRSASSGLLADARAAAQAGARLALGVTQAGNALLIAQSPIATHQARADAAGLALSLLLGVQGAASLFQTVRIES